MSLGDLKSGSPAILDAFYGGEKAAAALSSVLFGDYNPSGRLPMTMCKDLAFFPFSRNPHL